MATILPLDQSPTRRAEARAMAQIRQDCEAAGLNADQTQRALQRARESFRKRGAAVLPTFLAVAERAKSTGATPRSLLAGLQACFTALLGGRSPAVAIPEGTRAMRQADAVATPSHPAA